MAQQPSPLKLRSVIFGALALLTILVVIQQKTGELRTWSRAAGANGLPEPEWMQVDFVAQYVLFFQMGQEGKETPAALQGRLRQELEGFLEQRPRPQVPLRQSRCLGILWAHLGERDRASEWFSHALTQLRATPANVAVEEALWRALTNPAKVPAQVLKKAPDQVAGMDLGWYGDLALADLYERAHQPAQAQHYRKAVQRQCRRTVVTIFGLFGGMGLGALIGLLLGILFLTFYSAGEVRLAGPSHLAPAGLLAETFILYLFLTEVGAPLLFSLASAGSGRESPPTLVQAAPSLLAFMGAGALSLLWPASQLQMARRRKASCPKTMPAVPGKDQTATGDPVPAPDLPGPGSELAPPFSTLSLGRVLGWRLDHLGRDFLWGLGGYLAMLPILGLVLVILAFLLRFWGPHLPTPAHPLVQLFAADPSPWAVVVFALLGSLLAPLMEETLFRGALYGALRRRWGIGVSVVFSSTLFALLHPQLPLGFLPLFVLGAGFAWLYEIRGSLLPSVVAHALTNGVTLCLLDGLIGS